MSEHHHGAWGSREDAAAWWQGALASADYQQSLQSQHLQQQGDSAAAAAAVAQQLFAHSVAGGFHAPSVTSSAASCMRGGYDYARLTEGMVGGGGGAGGMLGDCGNRSGDLSGAAAMPASWWYAGGMGNAVQNSSHGQMIHHKGRMPRAKADAKPRGRMTAYAFFVQTCREEHKKKHPDENVIFAEFSKKCAERWKTMVDKEKKRFHEMAEKDKERYDTEMEGYTPPKGEKGRGKRRKHQKDPNAPKRSLSAFFWFCHDERGKVKAANPEFGVGEIAKELGRRWAECSSELKSKYEAMAEKDKARYDREMTAYKKRPKTGAGVAAPAATAKAESGGEEDDDEDDDEDEDE